MTTTRARCLVEFAGTFLLAFTIGMTSIEPGGAGAFTGLAVAGVLAAAIYAGGHLSGAHYNPAVTLAVAVLGRMPRREVLPYLAVQVAAAALAVPATLLLKPADAAAAIEAMTIRPLPALLAEAIFTFALLWVIFNVAFAKRTVGNEVYGLAIAAVVLAGIHAVRDVSGAAFNPAVLLFFGLTGLARWSDLWPHLLGIAGGAAAATALFRVTVRDAGGEA